MEFNTCGHCGADGGRAGLLINNLCLNCHDTKRLRTFVLHTDLKRTAEEVQKTAALIETPKSLEQLANSEELCRWCPIPEEHQGVKCYGGEPIMCEGRYCEDAYEAYYENFREEHT